MREVIMAFSAQNCLSIQLQNNSNLRATTKAEKVANKAIQIELQQQMYVIELRGMFWFKKILTNLTNFNRKLKKNSKI